MKQILALVLVFLTCSFTSSSTSTWHIEKVYYLKGTVGEREIALKMVCYDELPTRFVNYFFLDAKKDHSLIGKLKDNFWNFMPEQPEGRESGALKITESTNGDWNGTWDDGAGKSWPLTLKPIAPDSSRSDFSHLTLIKESDPYESYRLSNLHLNKMRTDKPIKGLLCDWYLEKESGISFFRFQSANNRLKTDSVNATLTALHLSLIQKHFSFIPKKTDTKVETSLLYITSELVSFRMLITSTFESDKTFQTTQLMTLDMKSGQPVKLEDLVWFDKTTPKAAPHDLFKLYKYQKNVLAPKVFHLLQELYPDKMKTASCEIDKVENWTLPVWNLTSKGIAFGFAKSEPCKVLDWAIIPYEKLAPFLEAKYHLKQP